MNEETEDIQVISVIPRCQTCNNHTTYIVKNKQSGVTKYFCALCGPLELLKYHNNKNEWDILSIQ